MNTKFFSGITSAIQSRQIWHIFKYQYHKSLQVLKICHPIQASFLKTNTKVVWGITHLPSNPGTLDINTMYTFSHWIFAIQSRHLSCAWSGWQMFDIDMSKHALCAWIGWQIWNAWKDFSVYVLWNDKYAWIGWQMFIAWKDFMILIFQDITTMPGLDGSCNAKKTVL